MQGLYLLDIASSVFVLAIIIFRAIHKIRNHFDIAFALILYSTLFFDLSHAAIEITMEINSQAYNLAYAFKLLSCIFFALIASGFAWYTYKAISKTNSLSKGYYLLVVYPIIWNIIVCILDLIFHICLEFNESGITYKGLYFLLFFPYIFIMIYMGLMCTIYKHSIYPTLFKTGVGIAVTALLYGILQMISYFISFDFISYTSLYFSVTIIFTFLYLQNDRIFVDETSGLYLRKKAIEDLDSTPTASVYLLQISKFHQFNSNTGDKILKNIVNFLKDIFNRYTMYRVSSNQIMIIAKGNDDIQKLNCIIDKYKDTINIDDESYYLNVKIALLYKDSKYNSEHTIYLLEAMINEIENSNKNYIIFEPELEKEFSTRENETKKVMGAMNAGGIKPYYQGIYSLDEEKIIWCEALARLNVNGSIVSPRDFLPILESHRCVSKLDREMLISVLKELKKMKDDGKTINVQGVSINFTADDILNPKFLDNIKELIKENEIDPKMISFEISESVVIENFETVRAIMKDLNDFGIRFFLDDFGTGFSNLNAVLNLPFYLIKIDKSLLDAARYSDKNQNILNGIIQAINSIGMKTLIEGVETADDVELVKKFGVHYIQGYYYNRPCGFDKFCDKR